MKYTSKLAEKVTNQTIPDVDADEGGPGSGQKGHSVPPMGSFEDYDKPKSEEPQRFSAKDREHFRAQHARARWGGSGKDDPVGVVKK